MKILQNCVLCIIYNRLSSGSTQVKYFWLEIWKNGTFIFAVGDVLLQKNQAACDILRLNGFAINILCAVHFLVHHYYLWLPQHVPGTE